MSRVCQVTGKGPVTGNNISHAHNKTRRRFLPNLQHHRFWVESEKRFVRLRVSAKGMRIIDKRGIDAVLAELRARGQGSRSCLCWLRFSCSTFSSAAFTSLAGRACQQCPHCSRYGDTQ